MTIKITGMENGPISVTGLDKVFTPNKMRVAAERPIFFCRCGRSKNKPFCDNSHADAEFKASAFSNDPDWAAANKGEK